MILTINRCTILTTTPNVLLQVIHDRMPVILNPAHYHSWLNPSARDVHTALQMLVPYSSSMRPYPVSAHLNQVQNDDPECAKPVELESPPQGELFCRVAFDEETDDTRYEMARRHSSGSRLQHVSWRHLPGEGFRPSTEPRRVSEIYSGTV